jgi:hypothetical protein
VSGRGHRASRPPANHVRPEPLTPDGTVVHHHNKHGHVKSFDFSALPVAQPMQRSLAAVFAARCMRRWTVHTSADAGFAHLKTFAKFLASLEQPPNDFDDLTVAMVKRWRASRTGRRGGYRDLAMIGSLLRDDKRLATGQVADELARRSHQSRSTVQSYGEAEFEKIVVAARRVFRAALLRINENAEHLERWWRAEFMTGTPEWVLGEGLDHLARTGDLPRYAPTKPSPSSKGGRRQILRRYRKPFGSQAAEATTLRLFLSRHEAIALGVLLVAEYGWKLSVIDHAEVPRALPDPGEDGYPTYRIPLEKARRGPGNQFETRNVTDDGAASNGRLITQALQATRFARAVVEQLAPGTDLLVVWRVIAPAATRRRSKDRPAPVGPFGFGVDSVSANEWAKRLGVATGSPFRLGRRTVNALDRREPGQNSQDTHDRDYVLPDKNVQDGAVEVIAAGAEDAERRARKAVLVAEIRDEPVPGDVATPTADCSDYDNSPSPGPDGGCGLSFLDCLGCTNARVHPGHHGQLALLRHSMGNMRSVLPPQDWDHGWSDHYARLDDLRAKVGEGPWTQALTATTAADRELIDLLLIGDLNA